MVLNYELAIGLKKGHQTTKIPVGVKKLKNKKRPRSSTKYNHFLKDLVREVCGFSPYEKRAMEFLKTSKDKKALRFLKKRIGTHSQAKKKREDLNTVLLNIRKTQTQQAK